MAKAKALSPFHERFVQHYLVTLDPSKALLAAGSEARGNSVKALAWRILQRADVQAAISEKQRILADELHINAAWVVREYAKVARANMAEYLAPDGTIALPMDKLSRMAALKSYTVDVIERQDGPVIIRTKIELHSKLAALDSLGRHLGLFRDGATLPKEPDAAAMDTREVARELLFALRVAAQDADSKPTPEQPAALH